MHAGLQLRTFYSLKVRITYCNSHLIFTLLWLCFTCHPEKYGFRKNSSNFGAIKNRGESCEHEYATRSRKIGKCMLRWKGGTQIDQSNFM
jgi:hypothetical protein